MNFGIIGIGYWGKHYIRILTSLSNKINLVALCEQNQELLTKYKYLNIKQFTDYIKLFESGLIDSVIIVTPASTHYKIIREAIKYNLNIFVEKPYTLSLKHCNDINSCLLDNTKLMIGHTHIFNPKIIYIKDFIIKNTMNVKTIHMEWSSICSTSAKTDTNVVFDLGIHCFSILLFLFPNGKFHKFHSIKSSSGYSYFITLMIDDIIISINLGFQSPGKVRKMIINDDNIKIKFNDTNSKTPIKIYYTNIPTPTKIVETNILQDGNVVIPQIQTTEDCLTTQIIHFMNYINNKEECISNHIFSTRVIEFCEKSIYNEN
jgi:UDP-N-acetylglucosamine 3-dehydrogenase